MNYLKYNYTVNTYNESKSVEVIKDCNGYTATNIGDTIVLVNNMILYPGTPGTSLGDSRTVGGNAGEVLDDTRLTISFTGAGSNPNVEIIQKFYK